MNDRDQALIQARAVADRQMQHVDATINDYLLPQAERLLQEHGSTTDAWALLGMDLLNQLRDRPDFLAEMLSRLAIITVRPPDQIDY